MAVNPSVPQDLQRRILDKLDCCPLTRLELLLAFPGIDPSTMTHALNAMVDSKHVALNFVTGKYHG